MIGLDYNSGYLLGAIQRPQSSIQILWPSVMLVTRGLLNFKR